MRSTKKLLLSCVAGVGLVLAIAAPASAYTACNREGDCWHTDSRVHFPGLTLSFHDDKWGDTHRNDTHYHWHDADNGHDWHHGYWRGGEWHSS
ncbi:MAG TPA: hypothetical protein VHZ32_05005 [Rhizomicrobium sp.]|jgi:hypothetical protein|nr:hypothetical protein [Rhizomicrobium sp.]